MKKHEWSPTSPGKVLGLHAAGETPFMMSPILSTFQNPPSTASIHAVLESVSLALDVPRSYLHATYVKS